MSDLTIIYCTANSFENKLSAGVRENLLNVAGEYPIISVSQKPMNFGKNICTGETGGNFYMQALKGAEEATTEYVAIAGDDCLYPKEHFCTYRPDNIFAFNVAKWSLSVRSNPPMYSWINEWSVPALIAPRKLLIERFTEKFIKNPDGNNYPLHFGAEREKCKKLLGPVTEFTTNDPVLVFFHDYAGVGAEKECGVMRAYDVACWGKAGDLVKKYINN